MAIRESIYHFTNSGQLYSQAPQNYPYSPRKIIVRPPEDPLSEFIIEGHPPPHQIVGEEDTANL